MFLNFTKNEILITFGLSLLKFAVGFISSMVIPVFPSLVNIHFNTSSQNASLNNKTDFNYHQLSILFVTKNLCQIISSPIVGIFADLFGYLMVLLSGTIFHIFTMLVYGLGNLYYLLILGRVFEAISASIINCAAAAYVAFRFKNHKQRGFVYGVKALSTCIGNSIGPAYAGVIYEYYGKVVLFLSFLCIVLLEILIVLLIIFTENKSTKINNAKLYIDVEIPKIENSITNEYMQLALSKESKSDVEVCLREDIHTECNDYLVENGKEIHKKREKKKENSCVYSILFFKDPYFLISIGTFPIIFITIYLLFSTLPRYMLITYNSTESQQGLVWLLTLLGYGFGFIIGNIINSKIPTKRHIIIMGYTFLHALVVVCIPFMPTWWSVTIPLCIIVHIHLVAEVVISPILANIVEIRHNSRFGIMSGIIMMAMAVTGSLGSFLGPLLLSTIGFMYTYIGICVLNVIFAPFYLYLKQFCQNK